MFKKLSVFFIVVSCVACPPCDPQTGPKTNPYATARSVIQAAQLSLYLADGLFEQWAFSQTDQSKISKVREMYDKIRLSVANGLKLALEGVEIAEQAQTDPDINKLLVKAEEAWQTLKTLLAGLSTGPSSLPTVLKASSPGAFTVGDLPKTLLRK